MLTLSSQVSGAAAPTGVPGIVVVLVGVIVIVLGIIVYSKIKAGKKAAAAEAAPAAEAPAAAPQVEAPGSAGEIKLYTTTDREAAMIMAIVAHKLGKPLNELRFKSIKEVKE